MNPPRFIDTHCHFNFPPFWGEEQRTLRQLAEIAETLYHNGLRLFRLPAESAEESHPPGAETQ